MRTAGVLGDISANRACFLTGRIGSKVETAWSERIAELEIHDSRLHRRAEIRDVDLEYAIHPRESKHDATLSGYRATAQTSSCSTRNDGQSLAPRELYDFGNLLRGLRKDNVLRFSTRERAVILIEHEVFAPIKHSIATRDPL